MSKQSKRLNQSGFTIVELMVATLVFSVILVVITSGVIHFTTSYYKGIQTSATQTTARDIMSIITQNLQYGGGADIEKDNTGDNTTLQKYMCVGNLQINTTLGHVLDGSPNVYGAYVAPNGGSCKITLPPPLGGKEMLANKMRVTNLSVTKVSGDNNLYKASVGVAYGDPDLLCSLSVAANAKGGCGASAPLIDSSLNADWWQSNGSKITCKSGNGSQFCAVSHLTTQVVSRFEPGTP